MNTIIVKTNSATQTVDQVQVVTKDGQPTVITAMDKVNYEFHDTAINRAPNHIITKHINNDLHVSFEENGKDSDLIIKGFYDNPDSALLGMAEDGEYYYYVPDTGETYDYVTQLAVGDVEGQALGGQDYVAAAAIPWWIPAIAGLGLVGIIAASSSSSDDDNSTPPPAPVNLKPIAEDDTQIGVRGEPTIITVLSNDSDPENSLDPSSVQLIDPITGESVDSVSVEGEGVWTINTATGAVTFTPENGFNEIPTPIDYVVSDTAGLTSDPATINVDYIIPVVIPSVVSINGTTSLNETAADGNPNEAIYTVNLSNPSTVDTIVAVVISDGSTEGSADYTPPVTQNVTIIAGSTSTSFNVPIIDDNLFEGPEDFNVTVTSVDSGTASINPTQSTVNTTIYDDGTTNGDDPVDPENPSLGDDTPVVSITDATVTEGDTLVHNVTLSNPSTTDTTYSFNLADVTTTVGDDYLIPVQFSAGVTDNNDGTITVDAGVTSFTVSYASVDDVYAELPETTSLTIGSASATGTINDDSGTPEAEVTTVTLSGDSSVDEGASATYTVTIDNAPINNDVTFDVTYSYPSVGGADGSDITTTTTQVTIPVNSTTATFSVDAIADGVFEGSEIFNVIISNVQGTDFEAITIVNDTVSTVINDGESQPVISIVGPAIVNEDAGTVSYTVSLSNSSADVVSVDYSTIDNSALAGSDYNATSGTLNFLAGEILKTITVDIVDDNVAELNEDYSISLSNASNATIDTVQGSVTTTILDDDSAPVINGITTTSVSEEGLVGGVPDNTALAGFTDTTDSALGFGVITVSDADLGSPSVLFITLDGPDGITSGGAAVTWVWDSVNNELIGRATINGNVEDVIKTTVLDFNPNGTGDYEAFYTTELLLPIDHPNPNGEDSLNLTFSATISDSANSSQSSFVLSVEDDSPLAEDVNVDAIVQPVNTNLLFVVDISGSMASGVGNGRDRLDLAKEALIETINEYDKYGEVSVRVVTFDTTASPIGAVWQSAADAIASINALTVGNLTNYDDALAQAISAFGDSGKIEATQDGNIPLNKGIFITDGDPNRSNGGTNSLTGSLNFFDGADSGIQLAEEAEWTAFLTNNKIDMEAYSIFPLTNTTELDPIAYDGSSGTGTEKDGIFVTPGTLGQSILDNINIQQITGNLVGPNSSALQIGADGSNTAVVDIVIDGGLYSFNTTTAQLTPGPGVDPSDYTYDMASTEVSVNTISGGILTIDFTTTEYNYQASQVIQPDYIETVSYTAVDSDGDSDTISLTLDITYDAQPIDIFNFDSASLDLTAISDIEVIDMANNQQQTLSLSIQDVIDITDNDNILFIEADSAIDTAGIADNVTLTGFTQAAVSNATGYDLYVSSTTSNSDVLLYVDTDASVVI